MVHDWLCGLRGGELVLDQIVQLVRREYESAGLYVMFNDGRKLTPAISQERTQCSDLGKGAISNRLRRWLLPLYPVAVRQISGMIAREHARKPIDLVISSSSAAVKGVRPPAGVPHLCYCHSPARYVWSRSDEYAGGLRGFGLAALGGSFRKWDARTASNVTQFVANSRYTAAEITRCYGREATVVYPALRAAFEREAGNDSDVAQERRVWLVVSALEPYKRVDLAIQAANCARAELVVVGDGSQRQRLGSLAGPTVRLVGRVSDQDLIAWYRRARLVLFPQVEDFGLVAVEAQACGAPVVGRAAGGALETVIDGATGALFDKPEVDSLLAAIQRCPSAGAQACRANAARFSAARFDSEMRVQIAAAVKAWSPR
jgi:glycosyltransferase involved in cell wall biosynthesis